MIVDRLGGAGARVLVGGGNWNEADAEARTALDADPSALYVPPFDHPLIWEGHSSIVDELAEAGEPPDAVVVGVGGGGLLRGVQLGAERLGWTDLQVFAVETEGTGAFPHIVFVPFMGGKHTPFCPVAGWTSKPFIQI